MKEKTSFELAVLMLAAVVLLLMGFRFVQEQRMRPGLESVETERSDTDSSVGRTDWPDSLLEGEVIHLNTASRYDLARVPGIGQTKAQAIVEWRQEHGPFRLVDDLLQVSGIGPETLEALKDYVTVE